MACFDAGTILRLIVTFAGLPISCGTAIKICGSPSRLRKNDLFSRNGNTLLPPGEMFRSSDKARDSQTRSPESPECIWISPTSTKAGSEPGSIRRGPRLNGTRRSKVKLSHTPGRMGRIWQVSSEYPCSPKGNTCTRMSGTPPPGAGRPAASGNRPRMFSRCDA